MAKGLFTVGFTLKEVEDILARAKANLKAGVIMTSYNTGATSTAKTIVAPTLEIVDECVHALKVLAPDRYRSAPTVLRANWRVNF